MVLAVTSSPQVLLVDGVDDSESNSLIYHNDAPKLLRRSSTFWASDRALLKRHPSLELLVPAHDCESRKSSPVIAIFNLVATVCGGGVLTLPLAFSRAGLIPSFLLMLFAAAITHFSMYILCSSARRTGGRSYGDVMRNAWGPQAEIGATALLFLLLFLVLVAYMVLLKDIWTPVITHLVPSLQDLIARGNKASDVDDIMSTASNYVLIALLFCIIPLVLQTDLHALRHTCYIGFVSAIILMVGVVYHAFHRNVIEEPGIFWDNVVWVGDTEGIMYAFPIIVLSFFSIYNVLTVHSALFNPTRSRVRVVLDGTILLCFILFYTVGLAGYLYAYSDCRDNVLLNFPLSFKMILVGRVGYGVTICLGFPLVFLPCRAAVLSLPEQVREWRKAVKEGGGDNISSMMKGTKHHIANGVTFDEECPLFLETKRVGSLEDTSTANSSVKDYSTIETSASGGDDSLEPFSIQPLPPVDPAIEDEIESKTVHIVSTLSIIIMTYIMAVAVPGVGVVWSIAGSSMAIIIGFIIPAACYLKIRSKKSINPRSVAASFILIFSILSSVVCTVRTVRDL